MLLVALWRHKSVWTCEMSCTLVGVSCNGRSLRFDAPLAQAEAERLAKKKAEAERVGMGRVCCKRCVRQLSIRAFIRLFVPQIAAEQAEAARKAAEAAKVVEYSIIHMTYVIIIIVCMFCVSSNTWDNEKELSECMKMDTHTTLVVVPPAFQAAEEAARKAKAEREEAEAKAAEEAAAAKAGAAVVQRRELRRMNRADQERCVISWLLASLRGSFFF